MARENEHTSYLEGNDPNITETLPSITSLNPPMLIATRPMKRPLSSSENRTSPAPRKRMRTKRKENSVPQPDQSTLEDQFDLTTFIDPALLLSDIMPFSTEQSDLSEFSPFSDNEITSVPQLDTSNEETNSALPLPKYRWTRRKASTVNKADPSKDKNLPPGLTRLHRRNYDPADPHNESGIHNIRQSCRPIAPAIKRLIMRAERGEIIPFPPDHLWEPRDRTMAYDEAKNTYVRGHATNREQWDATQEAWVVEQ